MAKNPNPQDVIYAAVGRALSEWSAVEDQLGKVYCTAINPRNSLSAERSYWAVTSFDARLKMVDAVINSRCKHKKIILTGWALVHTELVAQNRMRNKIAHGTVLRLTNPNPNAKVQKELFFVPYHYSRHTPEVLESVLKKKRDPRPAERLRARAINKTAEHFFNVGERLVLLYYAVQRVACEQEGVLLADEPRYQSLLAALTTQIQPNK